MSRSRVAILFPGDRAARDRADPAQSRFALLFDAMAAAGMDARAAVYHDDFAAEVQAQLLAVDVVLVWCNPIEGGQRRDRLDAMLRTVAAAGVLVSAHPDTILKLGTKDVLLATRHLPFGSDVHRIDSLAQLDSELPARLAAGPRVLKQHRGHSGIGVWRVEWLHTPGPAGEQQVLLQHAQRGSGAQRIGWPTLRQTLAPYFDAAHGGHLIDQAWQPRIGEGTVRAYLVGDRVAGFGHQAVNALLPAAAGQALPEPGPRLYSGPDDAAFATLLQRLQAGWVDQLCAAVGLAHAQLPLLWDCDFMHGGAAGYQLCEINVSSVSPFPPSAIAPLVMAVRRWLQVDSP